MVVAIEAKKRLTLEEFLALPETKPYGEYFDGDIEEKPMPQGEHSLIQTRLVIAINEVALPKKLVYALTELRCTFNGRSIVPDLAVFSYERIPRTETGKIVNKFETYPDWIIEILSPEQSANKVIKKIVFCINSGAKLGWLIDPEDESVMIFEPEKFPEIKSEHDILPVLPILEHWQLSGAEMFNWLKV